MKFSKTSSLGKIFACMFLLFMLAACQSLPPAPSAADAAQIDHLLMLIDQRLAVAPMVAKAKWNAGGAVNDPPREQLILDAVTAQAKGLDAGFVRRFFQAQFDASKALQLGLHAQWRRQGAGSFADAPDLGRDVRPVLDKLTPQLIAALGKIEPLLAQPGVPAYIEMRSRILVRGDLDGVPRGVALQGWLRN
ncbi:gamma subclass chorismate mutase AroQ [Collimonas silvisoli]|uniref:gamma subclass chorismate mutase AroQ n=1 Tax=Collimonas silvisoli TaxID=2825884 RepID=UPI001B8C6EA5|nr:gamma subclass chorismate mutase AroQ [Collimonas silvisoli]